MTSTLDIRVACPAWAEGVPGVEALCRRAAGAVLTEIGAIARPDEIAVLLTDDREMAALNEAWRGIPRPTNVLSFAAGPDTDCRRVAGDVVLAWETVAGEAAGRAVGLERHVAHLLVHGILHLAGHDHECEAEAERMEELEARALERIGLSACTEAPAGSS